jgi:hypothetical protein
MAPLHLLFLLEAEMLALLLLPSPARTYPGVLP